MAGKRKQESNKKRVKIVFGILLAALCLLFFRVGWIKAVHGESYEKASEKQQVQQTDTTIPALRGSIVDIKGSVLARSDRVYNMILDCKTILEVKETDTAQYNSTIQKIADILEIEESVVEQYLTPDYAAVRYQRFPEGRGIPYAKQQMLQQAIDKGDIVGIWFEEDEERIYLNDSLMAHVLGFNGSYGVEQVYDDNLRGVDGRQMVVANNAGSFVEEYTPSKDGDTLTLTLDETIQYYLEKHLQAGVSKYNAISGCAIAMDPQTGAILGLANVPTFDLNNARTAIGVTPKFTEQIGTPEENEEYYQYIWKNYAVNDTYEPGSTFKPIFATSALQEAVLSTETTFYCGGAIEYYDATIQCAYGEVHNVEKLEDIIRNSCNVGMTQLSSLMGVPNWIKYQRAYGIGQRTGIDLPGEVSAASLVYTEEMGPVELATTAFGQGFNVTPIQLITAFSAVINGGEVLTPYVVDHITDAYGNVVLNHEKQVSQYPISRDISDTMRGYLQEVVESGTGSLAQVEGYTIGGKTGTAQKIGKDGKYKEDAYVCSFIGFATAKDPQVVLLVILDEADHGTSNQPSEIASNIFTDILPYMNIYPDQE